MLIFQIIDRDIFILNQPQMPVIGRLSSKESGMTSEEVDQVTVAIRVKLPSASDILSALSTVFATLILFSLPLFTQFYQSLSQ